MKRNILEDLLNRRQDKVDEISILQSELHAIDYEIWTFIRKLTHQLKKEEESNEHNFR